MTLPRNAMHFFQKSLHLSVLLLMVACASVPTPPVAPAPTPSVEAPAPKKIPKLGLALGGGAARGFAHIGVLQVLEEEGIKPSLVVGTSAGSVVAAFYASGKTASQLQWLADTMDESQFTDWANPFTGRGMLRGEALGKYVNSQLNGMKIEDLKMPLGIVATDLRTGDGILFQRGDVATAVRASSAVPSVFEPVRIGGKDYVDGGLVSPVPVRYAKQMGADIVLAIDISSRPEDARTSDLLKVLLQTFSIMGKSISQLELAQADVVVRPALPDVGSAEFSARKKSIEAGRAAMRQALPQLKALLVP
ncbi:MAG: patatin-like phospholipase family protein [Limnohabitans sp.]